MKGIIFLTLLFVGCDIIDPPKPSHQASSIIHNKRATAWESVSNTNKLRTCLFVKNNIDKYNSCFLEKLNNTPCNFFFSDKFTKPYEAQRDLARGISLQCINELDPTKKMIESLGADIYFGSSDKKINKTTLKCLKSIGRFKHVEEYTERCF